MFAFSQMDRRDTGLVTHTETPLGRYFGAAFEQGWADSAFQSVQDITEMGLADENSPGLIRSAFMSLNEMQDASAGKKISAQEANNKYALPGLTFDRPMVEAQARLINERRQKDLERAYYLDESDTNPARWVGGLGVRMAAGMMNPLDLGLSFMPVIGSESAAANILGRGGRLAESRAAFARGLISDETIARLPAPKLIGAMITGTVTQAVLEVPVAISKIQGMQDYTATDVATDIAAGGIVSGALHLGLEAAGHLWRRLRPETREVMMRKAVDDFVKGNDIQVHDFVKIDENAIRDRVKFDPERVRAEAEAYAEKQMPGIRARLAEKGQYIVSAAVLGPDGTIHTGGIHPLIWDELEAAGRITEEDLDNFYDGNLSGITSLGDQKPWVNGFVTNTGKFIDREHAELLTEQAGETFAQLGFPDHGTTRYEKYRDEFLATHDLEGSIDLQRNLNEFRKWVIKKIQEERAQGMEEAVAKERDSLIRLFIEKKRQEHDPEKAFTAEVRAEIARQQREGKVLTEEQVKQHTMKETPDAADVASVAEDTARIMEELGITEEDIKEGSGGPPNLEDAIDEGVDCVIKNLL